MMVEVYHTGDNVRLTHLKVDEKGCPQGVLVEGVLEGIMDCENPQKSSVCIVREVKESIGLFTIRVKKRSFYYITDFEEGLDISRTGKIFPYFELRARRAV